MVEPTQNHNSIFLLINIIPEKCNDFLEIVSDWDYCERSHKLEDMWILFSIIMYVHTIQELLAGKWQF